MTMDIHVYHHFDPPLGPDHRMDRVIAILTALTTLGESTMATIADIQASVAAEKVVEDSVVALLNGISQQLKDAIAAGDPTAMQAVVDQIDANRQAMADAVAANTPAAP